MTGEERGQLFILELFICGNTFNPIEVRNKVSQYMNIFQSDSIMGHLYGSVNLTTIEPETIPRDLFLRENKKYKITEIGITYYNHLKTEKEKDDLNFEKLKFDVKNSERIFKTYWLTFAFAVIGFLISLTLLILKIKGK